MSMSDSEESSSDDEPLLPAQTNGHSRPPIAGRPNGVPQRQQAPSSSHQRPPQQQRPAMQHRQQPSQQQQRRPLQQRPQQQSSSSSLSQHQAQQQAAARKAAILKQRQLQQRQQQMRAQQQSGGAQRRPPQRQGNGSGSGSGGPRGPPPQQQQRRPVYRGGGSSSSDSESSDDMPLMKAPVKREPPKPATVRNKITLTKAQGTNKRSRMVIKRPDKNKKQRLSELAMDKFIVDGEVNSDDSDEESDGNDATYEDGMSDDDKPLRRARPNSARAGRPAGRPTANGHTQRSPGKAKKLAKPGRLRASKPAKSQKENWPVFSPDSYDERDPIPLEPEEAQTNWWNRPEGAGNDAGGEAAQAKWITLAHNGVLFPPAYEEHGVGVLYNGVPVKLSGENEEAATFYAVLRDSEHVKNPVFRANFFNDWKKLLPKDTPIKDLAKVDFTPIFDWYQKEKARKVEERKMPANKKKKSAQKALELSIYGYAIVDGVKQKLGNYMVELPGLFRGRGEHPKTGMLKRRIMPEDIVLNIGPEEAIPKCPIAGHKWGGVTHNNNVTYVAKWKDPIQNAPKMVFLHASSRFKGENDRKKYEIARELKKRIGGIRKRYTSELTSNSAPIRQRATAVYIIDKLAIRVGNEKDTSETADTVGVCTLRVEHITFEDGNRITLKFLGKDSMPYESTNEVPVEVYHNLKSFVSGKNDKHDIFDRLTTSGVNEYLSEFMEGLTAKVFRTYNASHTLQSLLTQEDANDNPTVTDESEVFQKKHFYDEANRQVAILCNHQKTVSSGADTAIEKSKLKLDDLEEKLKDLRDELAVATGKVKKARKNKPEKPKRIRSPPQIKAAIEKHKGRIEKARLELRMKEGSKGIALGTSKINYMDPRITVAWCKRMEMPIERIFQRALLDKFPWAMQVPLDYQF